MPGEDEKGEEKIIIPNISIAEAIKLIRVYSGKTDIGEWIIKFETDLLAFGIGYKYAIMSLDRFFSGDASEWWHSTSHKFDISDIKKDDAHFKKEWDDRITVEMKSFFSHKNRVAQNKETNKKIIFKLGDDAQAYVTKKLSCLREIDKNMKEDDKIEELCKGLPQNLRFQLECQDIQTVSDFLSRLQKLAKIAGETKEKEKKETTASTSKQSSPSHESSSESIKAITGNSSTPPSPHADKTCFSCGQRGHIAVVCPRNTHPQSHNPSRIPPLFSFQNQGRGYRPFQSRYSPRPNPFFNANNYMQNPFFQPRYSNNFSRGPNPFFFNNPMPVMNAQPTNALPIMNAPQNPMPIMNTPRNNPIPQQNNMLSITELTEQPSDSSRNQTSVQNNNQGN